jgi:hypothetical protein
MRSIEQIRHAAEERRRGKDTFFDSLIPVMSFDDSHDYEKGSIFTRGGALKLLACAVVVVSIALAVALA